MLLLPLIISSSLAATPDLYYPYGRVSLVLPPSENPFPGLGSYYTTLDKGMKSAPWNPATLGKLKLSEAAFSISTASGSYDLSKITKINEMSQTVEVGAGSGSKASFDTAIFFRHPSAINGMATKEVSVLSSVGYGTSISGINFSAAQRINNWLVVGFTSNNPLDASTSLGGNLPTTAKLGLNLYGKSLGDMQFTNTGKLRYTFNPSNPVTYETTQPVWSGFLTQETTFPFTNLSEVRNSINVQTPYLATLAAQFGSVYTGLNILPISATGKVDNDVRTVINSDVDNQFLYVPNFDPNNQAEIAQWTLDPDKYGTSAGYSRKQIDLPAGDVVANGRYRGFYTGSTSRLDLGFLYDVSDWCTVGLDLENIGGAALNMKGDNISNFISYRNINTAEVNNLLQPGQDSTWTPFFNTWVSTNEAGKDKPMYLEPEKNFPLPKRVRLGVAIKRPFLILLDLEQNQTPFSLSGSNEASTLTINNLNLLRFGFETQWFTLPLWSRFGTTFALKPSITGGDPSTVDSLNKVFKYGLLPLKIEFGSSLKLWDYLYTDSFGINALPAVNLLQFDINNVDLSKMIYYSATINKGSWDVNYLFQLDPLATASTYGEKPADSKGQRTFATSDLKYVQTLGVTYKF